MNLEQPWVSYFEIHVDKTANNLGFVNNNFRGFPVCKTSGSPVKGMQSRSW